MDGCGQSAVPKLDRIMKEGQRADLLLDLPDRFLNFIEEFGMSVLSFDAPQVSDAELQRDKQLARRIVELLPHPLPLVFVNPEQLVDRAGVVPGQLFVVIEEQGFTWIGDGGELMCNIVSPRGVGVQLFGLLTHHCCPIPKSATGTLLGRE